MEKDYDEEQIKKVLALLGKHTIDDEINCNGCGYDNCRNFAAIFNQPIQPRYPAFVISECRVEYGIFICMSTCMYVFI